MDPKLGSHGEPQTCWEAHSVMRQNSSSSSSFRARQSSSSRIISQARGHSPDCLPQGPATWKWVCHGFASDLCGQKHCWWPWGFWRPRPGIAGSGHIGSCNGLLLLVVLALSRPEKTLWLLLYQFPRHSFCGICGNDLEGLVLVAWEQKSLFSHWPTLLLSHILAWWHSAVTPWLLFIPLWLTICTAVRTVLRNEQRHI